MPRHYPGVNLTAVEDPATRDILLQMDKYLRDISRQLATQSTAGSSSSSGIVTSVSANSGTDVQGDTNLVDGNGIDITQSGQDFTMAADLTELGTTFLRLDATNDPMTAELDMGSDKVVGLVAGSASGDAIAHSLNPLNHLATATADYAMGTNKITALAAATTSGDALAHSLNPLNHLAAQTAAYDANGQTLTDWGGCTSSNAALLSIVADTTDGTGSSGVVGMVFKWDRNAAWTSNRKWFQWHVNDDVSNYVQMELGMVNGISNQQVLWFPDSSSGNQSGMTEAAIIAGNTDFYGSANTCGIRFRPQGASQLLFYVDGTAAMSLKSSTKDVDFAADWKFSTLSSPFQARTGTKNESRGGIQFGFANSTRHTSGRVFTVYDNIPPGTAGVISQLMFAVDWEGKLFTGMSGQVAVAPIDGGLFAQGWISASTATNQAGVDLFVAAGPATGNSAVKGDIHFQTPDVGASGTAVQALTTKATLTREGELLVGNPATSQRDVLRYALLAA